MTRTSSLYQTCRELFADYPSAIRIVNYSGTLQSMILMLQDSNTVRFFVLSRDCGNDGPFYSLSPWGAKDIVDIETDGPTAPDVVVNAVTHGTPIPRHGSLFGWRRSDAVTALIAVYTRSTPACPEPCWAVMPRVGTPAAQWPPFTGEPLFGRWFWEHYRAGSIVSLDTLIAATSNTVFWVATEATLGWDCCAVARDISSEGGYTLQRGRYFYYQGLRADKSVPSLEALLASADKMDLAPRFQRAGHIDGLPQAGG